jgi:hypothetical protein
MRDEKMKQPYGLMVDMDGVLCAFRTHSRNILGYGWDSHHFNTHEKRMERGKQLSNTKGFWSDMPPEPDFNELWGFIRPFEPSILTAYPQWDDTGAKKGKWEWNMKHTHVPHEKFHCVERSSKQYYAKEYDGSYFGKPNVLIDDMQQNITEWDRKGGIGILHTSAFNTINRLKVLGFAH